MCLEVLLYKSLLYVLDLCLFIWKCLLLQCPDGCGSKLLSQWVKYMPWEAVSKPSMVVTHTNCFLYYCDLTDSIRKHKKVSLFSSLHLETQQKCRFLHQLKQHLICLWTSSVGKMRQSKAEAEQGCGQLSTTNSDLPKSVES